MSQIDPSDRDYVVSVCLAGVFGVLGVHHFYLGRWLHGLVDLSMTVGGLAFIFTGYLWAGCFVLFVDFVHTVVVIYWLLTGQYHDGRGDLVLYPGQNTSSQ